MKRPDWAQKPWITGVLLALAAAGVGLVSLCFAVTARRWAMLLSYVQHPLLLLLNLLPCVLLCLFLWALLGRPLPAYGITAAVVFGLSLANWYKLHFRNDPLLFGDLLLAPEAGNMLSRYRLFWTPELAGALVLLTAGGVLLFFFACGRIRAKKPRLLLAGGLLALMLLCIPLYGSRELYDHKTDNFELANRWSSTEVYTSKGFLYPFLHSVSSSIEHPPEGYKKAEAQAVLAAYTDRDIPEDKKVDLLCVMLEAFNDFSKYEELQLAQDVYEDYHRLEKESYAGDLITSVFAGGTVTTERAFLTGIARLGTLRQPTNSAAWYLAEQGYTVTGSHPGYQWFYNRQNINENLGLENYLFQENHYGALAPDGTIARDQQLFAELGRLYDEHAAEQGSPYFSFSVTYQGHGPYNTDVNDWGENFVKPGVYSEVTENILNNYLGSVRSTFRAVTDFVDRYRQADRPVVIVLFGDHNPWLGDDNSVYRELGMDLDTSQKQGFCNYYGTRYLIWANQAAKKALGSSFTGRGPALSPNFLMNQVFRLCGWEGSAYMQYTDRVMETVPVLQAKGVYLTAEGEFLPDPAQESSVTPLMEEFARVEYYFRTQFQYREVAEDRRKRQASPVY